MSAPGFSFEERNIVRIMPASMAERRERPDLIERAYGVPEKGEETIPLPSMFRVKEKAQLYTHSWLAPVIYSYEREKGAIALREILPVAPSAVYTIESIGGEINESI